MLKEYIDEGISGEILDRPALSKLREDVKKGLIHKVICLDPDRLSRKLMNQLIITDELEKRGVELVFVNGEYTKTPEGNLFYSMRGAISEFEKAKINERMTRGRKEKARQGKVLRDFQVYGYDYDSESETFVINEEEAQVVRLIFDLFTKPNNLVQGINGIARYLTEKGIKTKRGAKVWHRQVVRQILMNPIYIGEFYQNKWNTEGMLTNKHRAREDRVAIRKRPKEEWIKIPCPAIIDLNTFQHAQCLLEESRRRWTKQGKHKYLLSGLVRCGDCRNTMTGRKARNWGTVVFEYTDRKNFMGAKHPGCGRTIRCSELDHSVWEQLLDWLNQPDCIALAAQTKSVFESYKLEEVEIKQLEKEIKKVRTGIKRLLRLYASSEEIIAENELRDEIQSLKEREEKLMNQLTQRQKQHQKGEERYDPAELMKKATDYYLNQSQGDWLFEDKQAFIRQVIKEIIIYDNRVEIYTF